MLHTQLFNKIPIGIHNSLNPRPELQIRRDDDLPVHAAHSLQDLGPKGGQSGMRLFTDLSPNFAPHELIYRIKTW
jgi:hypothetical protein